MTAATFLLAAVAAAQTPNLGATDPTRPHMVTAELGAEHAFVVGFGYSHALAVKDRPLVMSATVDLPFADLDVFDHRLELAAALPVLERRQVKLVPRLASSLRGTRTELVRMTGLGVDLGLSTGLFGNRGFGAFETGLDLGLATYIAHTDLFREYVFDAVDGWYANTSANLRFGLAGGVSVGRVDLVARLGQGRTAALAPQLMPFYATFAAYVKL